MNIFITGAESTGKSTLARQVAEHFGLPLVTEYARDYIGNLSRKYTPEDIEIIAKQQIQQIKDLSGEDVVVFDTGLIITYIWFKVKYGKVPSWFEESIQEYAKGAYLICDTDIPWHSDPLRENPDRREELNSLYQAKIKEYGFPNQIVKGKAENRVRNAIGIIREWLPELNEKG